MSADSERLKLALEAVTIPRDGRNYSAAEYFQHPVESRENDSKKGVIATLEVWLAVL